MRVYPNQTGFSLLELILVIVLLGILASGAGLLISTPIKAYSDQLRRTQLVDQGELALRQIALDIRGALPNSIRFQDLGADGWALEMTNTLAGARYRDEKGGTTFVTDEHILDFIQEDTDFNFLGILRSGLTGPTELPSGQRLVIYGTGHDSFYTDVTNADSGIVTPSTSTLTLSTLSGGVDDDEQHVKISPAFKFSQKSPGQRVFLIDGPISYICDTRAGITRINRYTGYAYQVTQLKTNGDLNGLTDVKTGAVATQVTACSIDYDAGTAQRSGIITLGLTLKDGPTGEAVTLLHQVHVQNVP
jgi:MSHA biogenesis protein MshO